MRILISILFYTIYAQDCNSEEIEIWGSCYSIPNTIILQNTNNTTGNFPESICELMNLEILDLEVMWGGNNQISGQIPECIGNLQNLTLLDLDENQIEYIPDSICQIAQNDCYIELDGNNLCEEFHFECFINEATWDYFDMSPQDQSNCCEGPNGEPNWTQCP